MTNTEEIIALLIFVPCVFCVVAGIISMASYRCPCCCPSSNHRRSRPCPTHQEVPMRVLRLTQHSYRRLISSSSTAVNHNESFGYEDQNRHEVTEFDYRQNLHMECGVVALEPPPSYAAAMKEQHHKRPREENSHCSSSTGQEEEEGDEDRVERRENYTSIIHLSSAGSPPPYDEDGESLVTNRREREGPPGRNRELIRLAVYPVSANQQVSRSTIVDVSRV